MKKTTVSVTGCSLADILYADIDFNSQAFSACASRRDGDGGLAPGRLVFADALEAFAGRDYTSLKQELTGGRAPHAENLGGPAVVGAINASQILSDLPVSFRFYGATGNDATADFVRSIIARTPLNADNYITLPGSTPSTDVLSDPRAHSGKGERTFINTIGACYAYTPERLPDTFFDADIVWFGATALVPPLHENLSRLLKRSHDAGKINIVSTVFDFLNEMRNPGKPWPTGILSLHRPPDRRLGGGCTSFRKRRSRRILRVLPRRGGVLLCRHARGQGFPRMVRRTALCGNPSDRLSGFSAGR